MPLLTTDASRNIFSSSGSGSHSSLDGSVPWSSVDNSQDLRVSYAISLHVKLGSRYNRSLCLELNVDSGPEVEVMGIYTQEVSGE